MILICASSAKFGSFVLPGNDHCPGCGMMYTTSSFCKLPKTIPRVCFGSSVQLCVGHRAFGPIESNWQNGNKWKQPRWVQSVVMCCGSCFLLPLRLTSFGSVVMLQEHLECVFLIGEPGGPVPFTFAHFCTKRCFLFWKSPVVHLGAWWSIHLLQVSYFTLWSPTKSHQVHWYTCACWNWIGGRAKQMIQTTWLINWEVQRICCRWIREWRDQILCIPRRQAERGELENSFVMCSKSFCCWASNLVAFHWLDVRKAKDQKFILRSPGMLDINIQAQQYN